MKQNTLTLGAGIMGLALAGGILTAYAQTDITSDTTEAVAETTRAERHEEHHAEMKELFESGDYNAWVEHIEERQSEMNEQFEQMKSEDSYNTAKELHELRETDPEAFRERMKELHDSGELPAFGMHGPGKMMRGGQGHGFTDTK